jgi:hypothetical protein
VRDLARGDEHDHLSLIADVERVNRREETRAQQGRDPLALEQTPDDECLCMIATVNLCQLALDVKLGQRGPRSGKGNNLASLAHSDSLQSVAR